MTGIGSRQEEAFGAGATARGDTRPHPDAGRVAAEQHHRGPEQAASPVAGTIVERRNECLRVLLCVQQVGYLDEMLLRASDRRRTNTARDSRFFGGNAGQCSILLNTTPVDYTSLVEVALPFRLCALAVSELYVCTQHCYH